MNEEIKQAFANLKDSLDEYEIRDLYLIEGYVTALLELTHNKNENNINNPDRPTT